MTSINTATDHKWVLLFCKSGRQASQLQHRLILENRREKGKGKSYVWVRRQFCFLLQCRLYIAYTLFTHIYIVAQQGYAMRQTGITVMLWTYHSVERRREGGGFWADGESFGFCS